jgi:hypothetical protein
MNTKNTLILAAASLAILTTVNAASASEPLLSPRAKSNLVRTIPGVTECKLEHSILPGSPKGRELAYSLRTVRSIGPSVDLAHGPRPLLSPKDPRYDAALFELRGASFQVAPLK